MARRGRSLPRRLRVNDSGKRHAAREKPESNVSDGTKGACIDPNFMSLPAQLAHKGNGVISQPLAKHRTPRPTGWQCGKLARRHSDYRTIEIKRNSHISCTKVQMHGLRTTGRFAAANSTGVRTQDRQCPTHACLSVRSRADTQYKRKVSRPCNCFYLTVLAVLAFGVCRQVSGSSAAGSPVQIHFRDPFSNAGVNTATTDGDSPTTATMPSGVTST